LLSLEFCGASGQDTERHFVKGWSDPTIHYGHGTVAKSGVAPAHPGVLPASKVVVAPCATSSPLGSCWIVQVNAAVTAKVICVFHAPVTLSHWKMAKESF
jgi:hypothetical protein